MKVSLVLACFPLSAAWVSLPRLPRAARLTMREAHAPTSAAALRELIATAQERKEVLLMPCVYDGLTARLVERAGFNVTFMTGYGVSAVHGLPDTQLMSYGEMVESARVVTSALKKIPCIGDGDTGYGGFPNVERTLRGYAAAGLAGIMLEDQVSPKRCGHTAGKDVVSHDEAVGRVRAAVRARARMREEHKGDLVIIARTDAAGPLGMDEALRRCAAFRELLDDTDLTFLEAPTSEGEMARYCSEVPGPKLANCLENGLTPMLPPAALAQLGFTIAAYPLSLLAASIKAMDAVLLALRDPAGLGAAGLEADASGLLAPFGEVCDAVGFTEYDAREEALRQP